MLKKCKDFKYTDSALITFLITGAVNITNNLFSAETGKSIENQKQVTQSIHGSPKRKRQTSKKIKYGTNQANGTRRSCS